MVWSSGKTSEKFGIQPFDGKSFDHWKFRMEIILDSQDVKKCIEEETNEPSEAFLKLDKKFKSIIVQCVANSHLEYIKDKTTAFQMWEAVKDVFQRKGMTGQLYLRKKLLTMKIENGTNLETHFIKFEEVVRELKAVGTKMEEIDIVCHLLLTLPKSLDPIVTALETLDSSKLTLEFVKGKLLDHEIKCKSTDADVFGNSSAFYGGIKTPNNDNRKSMSENCKVCSVCDQTKITRLPYKKVSNKITKSPLELVHSDICGPITPCTYDDKKYILTFLDDYTHFSVVYLLKNKSDFFECFKKFEAMMTNQLNCKIKVVGCDNGKEYCSNTFRQLCDPKV